MGRINIDMIRKRAEHNEGMVSTLQEVALHQQNIEKIEVLGHLCRDLRIVYLQNNLISKIENLHRLKELTYLNLALNNITKIENLQRCESLQKLDLTINFIPKQGLLSLRSLAPCYHLTELFLIGNPCADWDAYRAYVVATLPGLKRLDGKDVTPSERIAAQQVLPALETRLRDECRADGIDPEEWLRVDNQGPEDDEEVAETGVLGEDGQMKRPWCPATRVLEHREMEAKERAAEEQRRKEQEKMVGGDGAVRKAPRREGFEELPEGGVESGKVFMKNEGKWPFSVCESEDGGSIVLSLGVGRYLDTSLIQADVQPRVVRLLVKGRLFQYVLPDEVLSDQAIAQRSQTTGELVVTMPKADPTKGAHPMFGKRSAFAGPVKNKPAEVAKAGRAAEGKENSGGGAVDVRGIVRKDEGEAPVIREVRKAAVVACEDDDDDDDYVPPLS
ncbi:unnamed protein product [Pedinophyceae sp. YPF-701]|nr:unnamed protein product [Pedinophyceae sp. YPF-701]